MYYFPISTSFSVFLKNKMLTNYHLLNTNKNEILQLLALITIISIFKISNFYNLDYLSTIEYTHKFISNIAPLVIVICAAVGFSHFVFNKHFGYLLRGSNHRFIPKVCGLTIIFGCTKLMLLIKGEKVELSNAERLSLLIICFCSAGGLTCLSLSALGFCTYKLLLASLILPIYIGILVLPFSVFLSKRKQCINNENRVKKTQLSCFEYLKNYVIGGCKLVVNKSLVILSFELLKRFFVFDHIDFSHITYWPRLLLGRLGIDEVTVSVLVDAWIFKTLINRDMAMIYLANENVFDSLTFVQQFFTLPLLINITGISAVVLIGLNVLAFFGKKGWPFIKMLPFAVMISLIAPLIPLVIYAICIGE